MTTTATFTGFTPPKPQGRFFDLWRQVIPQKAREKDVTRALRRIVNCWQEVLDHLLYDLDLFPEQLGDPDKADIDVIRQMLRDMGNPFQDWTELELTENQEKKLLRYLVAIYKLKGTDIGIESVVFFLLNKTVRVIPYAVEGWSLGEDELGEAGIAEVVSPAGEPYDFSGLTWPLDLEMLVDKTTTETVELNIGDVADPAAVETEEIVVSLNAQLLGAKARSVHPGTHGVTISDAETFNLVGGETLVFEIEGQSYTAVFRPYDFVTPGTATADEVAARLMLTAPSVINAQGAEIQGMSGRRVRLATIQRGMTATIDIVGGTAAAILNFSPATVAGVDTSNLAIYSTTVGEHAEIELLGGDLYDAMGWQFGEDAAASGTGGTILGPSESATLYSFDIETDDVLTSEEEQIIRRIADYMKPAHTHLIQVRSSEEITFPDIWVLGEAELDVTTELHA